MSATRLRALREAAPWVLAAAFLLVACTVEPDDQSSPDSPPDAAGILLVTDDLGDLPFSVVCNVQRVGEVVHTAAHCLERGPRFVALGGASMCEAMGWTLRPVEPGSWSIDGEAAWAMLAPKSGSTQAPVMDDPLSVSSDSVEVQGFGRTDGSGPTACERQTFAAELVDLEECATVRARVEVDGGRWSCLSGPALCPGSSGSGVFRSGELVGVVSAGDACADRNGRTLVARLRDVP